MSTIVNCICASAPDHKCRHCRGLGVAKLVGTDLRPLGFKDFNRAAEASIAGLESTIDVMSVETIEMVANAA